MNQKGSQRMEGYIIKQTDAKSEKYEDVKCDSISKLNFIDRQNSTQA